MKVSVFLTGVIFLISSLIIISHFYFISAGFYFTGDTISYFEPAFPGKKGDLLSVFVWSYASWPPALSFIFNMLRFLPISFISQHQFFVLLINFISVIVVYFLAAQLNKDKVWQIVLVAMLLFTGTQNFLFSVALSEPLLIFSWLATIFCIERFIHTNQERFLIFYVFVGSLIPLSRYSGIWVLLSFNIVLILYLIITWKKKKYSPALVLTSSVLTWVPILTYLFRNYILTNAFLSGIPILMDPELKILKNALMSFMPDVFKDTWMFFIAGLILGIHLKWNKAIKILLILTAFSTMLYYFGFALSLTKFRGSDAFHSRYISVAYPQIILFAICVGAFFARRMLKLTVILMIGNIFLIFVLMNQFISSFNKYQQEINSPQSIARGVEYSLDIRKFCMGKVANKYLFLQESSRNWAVQSLNFYCQPISIIPTSAKIFSLPKNAYLFTPYKLSDPNLNLHTLYFGEKEVRIYRAIEETILNIDEELQKQVPLDWFSGARFVSSDKKLEFNQTEQWVLYQSKDLGFSTYIPETWNVYSVPQRGAVFLISNIFRGDKEHQSDFYAISAQRLYLGNKTLENLFYTDKFLLEKRDNYLIYKSFVLSTQENMAAVFISRDGKNFLRYSTAPISLENSSSAQKRIIEYLNKIVESTELIN